MIEKYYEEELRYLYESGREFAKAHPDRARFLNIDSLGDRDPYVERLFEGFAFLVGRVREKLDDTFPQLTEGLTNLLWPQFLQEIPSLAIVQFEPRLGYLQESRILPVRSEIMSGPVGPEAAICKFTTTHPLVLNPITLSSVIKETDNYKNEIISFTFSLDQTVDWIKYNLKSIRLFLNAELPIAFAAHRLLTRSVKKVEILKNSDNSVFSIDPRKGITPGGMDKDETLLPTTQRAFWGYNLLREYFVYPEKFLFIDLNGIDTLPQIQETPATITYRVTIDEQFPVDRPFSAKIFKLNCVPVSNVFVQNTEPVLKTGLQPEYRVVANSALRKSTRVHSIRSVLGIDRITGTQTPYEPLYSFSNIGNRKINTYATRFIINAEGKREMNIQLGGAQLDKKQINQETLVIDAWCTNGNIPRESIHEGEITNPGKGFSDFLKLTNLTRPTLPVAPPLDNELLWMFQTHLAATQAGLTTKGILKKFLQIYNWSGLEGNDRRIDSISDVKSEPVESVYKGSVIRGLLFTVTLEEIAFKDNGDLHLFGFVLLQFLSHYVQLNTFCELQFILKPTGKTMSWNYIEGKRCLI